MLRLLVALVAVALVGAVPATSSAAVTRDGWGLGLADDSYLTPGFPIPDDFRALGAKTFRLQIHWNASCTPGRIESARDWIAQARALGAEEIAVTFKENPTVDCGDPVNCGPQPTEECYAARIGEVIQALASDVDVWGPANEPNLGDTWLPGAAGARLLARYWSVFAGAVALGDPSARTISPEFADRKDLGGIAAYVKAYAAAGGGFGNYAGYHAYWGVHARSSAPTDEFAALLPPGVPIWITEVGAFGRNPNRDIANSEREQQVRVDWLLNDPRGLANHPSVARISYYHLQGSPDRSSWDSGLSRPDGTPRPSWGTWCAAAHGGATTACRDGADAIAVDAAGQPVVGRSHGNGFLAPRAWSQVPLAGGHAVEFADVTGDGRADAVSLADPRGVVVRRSAGAAFGSDELWTDASFQGSAELHLADVTGDGRADVVAVDGTGILVRRSSGASFARVERWAHSPLRGFAATHFADVTGDGRADAITIELGGVTAVRRSTGAGFGSEELWIPFYGAPATDFADVTGDGRADAISARGGAIVVRRSTGDGFGGYEVWTEIPFFGSRDTLFADVTGDLRADAIAVDAGGGVVVRRSRGYGFLPNEPWMGGPLGGTLDVRFADVTGS